MKAIKLDHIGIVVKSIINSSKLYKDILGLSIVGEELVAEYKVKVAFLPIGDTKIELIEAISPESPAAIFLKTHGEGIHHIALRVNDIEEVIEELKNKGILLLDSEPKKGAHDARIAFLHPDTIKGIRIELVERKD